MDDSEFIKFLKSRRSIRQFKQKPIPQDVIRRLLEVSTYAPSAHNKQPWRFIVITNNEEKVRLGRAITDKFRQDLTQEGIPEKEIRARIDKSIHRINNAPLVIIICQDQSESISNKEKTHYQKEVVLDIQSVAMGGLQLLLAAHAEGLGGTWICWPLFAQEETRKALTLPPEWDPQGMLFIGYPDEDPIAPARKPIKEVVRFIP